MLKERWTSVVASSISRGSWAALLTEELHGSISHSSLPHALRVSDNYDKKVAATLLKNTICIKLNTEDTPPDPAES